MKPIITSILDSDLYTFTCLRYILQKYPDAEVEYTFFDRNNFKYPKGTAYYLQEQVNMLQNLSLTDDEAEFMKKKCYFIPEWFWTLLKGYRFDPSEVKISQDEEDHLHITICGKWWRTILWEMPLLSMVSEITHTLNHDVEKIEDMMEYKRAFAKCKEMILNGVRFSDMGTRRRLSLVHHDNVIKAFKACQEKYADAPGAFLGTSNCMLAHKYNLPIIGTMSHQIISFEENISGVHECNYAVMKNWSDVYDGSLGIFLYDCFGENAFFKNASAKYLKLFDGLRVDSGDNLDQLEKIIAMYKSFGINPHNKAVVFSNALSVNDAIELHKKINGRVADSFGIGTNLTCFFGDDFGKVPSLDIKPMNIVIKLTKMRYSPKREWHDCVKLSCDKGKTLGNADKCKYLLNIL